MKFRSLVFTVCLTLLPAAASAGPMWLGATAGIGMPFGDFSDIASTGFNIAGNAEYEFSDYLAAGGEIGWHSYGGNDDYEKSLSVLYGTSADVTTSSIPLLAYGKFTVPAGGASSAYAKLELGAYRTNFKLDAGPFSGDDTSTDFALGLGGGWNYRVGGMRYGVEGMFHFVSTEGNSTDIFLVRGLIQFGGGAN